MTPPKWTSRCLAVAVALGVSAVVATAGRAGAEPPANFRAKDGQPKTDPKADPKAPKAGDTKTDPKVQPKVDHPKVNLPVHTHPVIGPPRAPAIIIHPQINSWPGIPANQINPPLYNPGPFYNPALNNPWMNQTNFIPTNPYANNPYNNSFNSPFMTNPLNRNPFMNNPFNNQFNNPYGPTTTYTPPMAIKQPGQLMWRGPDLQVNPTSGLVYKPISGIARTADGSIFYHVPNTGLPTFTGAYAPGSGLYYDPQHGTFLNPSTGVISKPGVTNVFIPWIP